MLTPFQLCNSIQSGLECIIIIVVNVQATFINLIMKSIHFLLLVQFRVVVADIKPKEIEGQLK